LSNLPLTVQRRAAYTALLNANEKERVMSHAMQIADEPELDFDKARAFTGVLAGHYNSAAITLMLSVGHRTGLLNAMGRLPPANSHEIAAVAGLQERYVREWLASMVMGRIVEYDPRTRTYWLPVEHAASLTEGAPLGNWAIWSQGMPIAGAAQEEVIHHFREGGGTHYHDYPHFHDFMAEDSSQSIVQAIDDKVLPLVPGLREKLEAGIDVLDVGCGQGRAMVALAAKFPRSRFRGYDFSADAIATGRKLAAEQKLGNVALEVVDMSDFGEIGRYDLITTFDAVHDQKRPQDLIRGIHAALRRGGTYVMQDIGGSATLENNFEFPMAAYLYAISTMHCMAVSLGQDGEGLGTMWGWETAQAMLQTTGFASINLHRLEHDPLNVWFVAHKKA
jgi:2-polyprenyl-3-methyl-5-hydroxy-6-metoxy-1,4-benzoquinol methylase